MFTWREMSFFSTFHYSGSEKHFLLLFKSDSLASRAFHEWSGSKYLCKKLTGIAAETFLVDCN
jgi:hypothetical protein